MGGRRDGHRSTRSPHCRRAGVSRPHRDAHRRGRRCGLPGGLVDAVGGGGLVQLPPLLLASPSRRPRPNCCHQQTRVDLSGTTSDDHLLPPREAPTCARPCRDGRRGMWGRSVASSACTSRSPPSTRSSRSSLSSGRTPSSSPSLGTTTALRWGWFTGHGTAVLIGLRDRRLRRSVGPGMGPSWPRSGRPARLRLPPGQCEAPGDRQLCDQSWCPDRVAPGGYVMWVVGGVLAAANPFRWLSGPGTAVRRAFRAHGLHRDRQRLHRPDRQQLLGWW